MSTYLRKKIFTILLIISTFDVGLVLFRNYLIYEQEGHFAILVNDAPWSVSFMFLIWNLFLAWIPYGLSQGLSWNKKNKFGRLFMFAQLGCWLLFFPNAPYIVTDLLHLKYRAPIPHWYDLLTIFSFACTGLLLGYFSLLNVERFLAEKIAYRYARWSSLFFLCLAGFGVYLGRFQRWNSWDIISQPKSLFFEILDTLSHPLAHIQTLGLAFVLSVMLILGYFTLSALAVVREQNK